LKLPRLENTITEVAGIYFTVNFYFFGAEIDSLFPSAYFIALSVCQLVEASVNDLAAIPRGISTLSSTHDSWLTAAQAVNIVSDGDSTSAYCSRFAPPIHFQKYASNVIFPYTCI
jgi:hypothetical protein